MRCGGGGYGVNMPNFSEVVQRVIALMWICSAPAGDRMKTHSLYLKERIHPNSRSPTHEVMSTTRTVVQQMPGSHARMDRNVLLGRPDQRRRAQYIAATYTGSTRLVDHLAMARIITRNHGRKQTNSFLLRIVRPHARGVGQYLANTDGETDRYYQGLSTSRTMARAIPRNHAHRNRKTLLILSTTRASPRARLRNHARRGRNWSLDLSTTRTMARTLPRNHGRHIRIVLYFVC